MKKTLIFICFMLSAVIVFSSCTTTESEQTYSDVSVPETEESVMPEDISNADLSGMDFEFTDRDKDSDFDASNASSATESDGKYEITSEGTYIFSGNISKQISVNAGENDKIQIVLDNVNISNPNGPAIYIGTADKVFITVKDGTASTLSDGSDYSLTDDNGEIDGAIFSRADLTINGKGTLTVKGNYKHGIVSKDDLVVVDTAIDIDAKNVALNGKDCVKLQNVNLKIVAGSDGIRSSNDEDPTRGFVYIESGKLDIVSANDGIQAETAVKIQNGNIKIVSGGGSLAKNLDLTESYKGIKAASDIIIQDGEFNIDSLDDAIHSNNTICIYGGKYNLSSADDGIHSDTDLAISAGDITVAKSYEGLESSRIFITGGNIDITSSDDGLNAAGGNDASAGNNPMAGGTPPGGFGGGGFGGGGFGKDAFDNGIGEIAISGGYTLIDASGDGIDSNGTFALTGGVVLVSGPTNNGNGAFDYGKSASVTGGVLVALGSSGMAQGFSSAENQGAIITTFSYRSGNTNIALCDENGNAILVFKPKKDYQSAVITAPEIQQGKTYKLYAAVEINGADENGFARNVAYSGGTHIADITMDSLLYGTGGGFRPGPGGGDHGGGPGGIR